MIYLFFIFKEVVKLLFLDLLKLTIFFLMGVEISKIFALTQFHPKAGSSIIVTYLVFQFFYSAKIFCLKPRIRMISFLLISLPLSPFQEQVFLIVSHPFVKN